MSNINCEYEIVHEHMQSSEYKERLRRDIELTDRIKTGYTYPESTEDNPNPRIGDGQLDEDASDALSKLFVAYEPLIRKISNREYYRLKNTSPMISKEDLSQEGFDGLLRASLAWKPERGAGSFTGYARKSIWGSVRRYTDEKRSTVRVPSNMRIAVDCYRNTVWNIYSNDEHLPKRERVARALGISVEEVTDIEQIEAIADQMGSIDGGYFEDDRDEHSIFGMRENRWKPIDPSASEARAIEEEILVTEVKDIVNKTLQDLSINKKLSDEEIKVIQMRYLKADGERLSLEEIGSVLGITRERVRQIESKALAKMRHPQVRSALKDLVGN